MDPHEWLTGPQAPKPTPNGRPATPAILDLGEGEGWAASALAYELDAVKNAEEGTRNDTLNTAAFNLGQIVAGGGLEENLVADALAEAGELAGLDPREIRATIASGLGAGYEHPRYRPEPPAVGSEAQNAALAVSQVAEGLGPPCTDWEALWADPAEQEWLIEPLIPASRIVAIYSAPKVGKSLLLLELAAGLASGRSVLGAPARRARVLYVDFENNMPADIRPRLQAMGYTPGDLGDLRYLSFPDLAALDTPAGGLTLCAIAEREQVELIVLDTVSRTIKGEENSNDTWLAFNRCTLNPVRRAGLALVRLDHSGKDEDKGQRGASAKSGDVDAVWKLSKVTETGFRLACDMSRYPLTERVFALRRETEPLRHIVDAGGTYALYKAGVAALMQALDRLGVPRSAGRVVAREALDAASVPVKTDWLTEALRLRKLDLEDGSEDD